MWWDRSGRFFAGLNSQVLEEQLESVNVFFGFDMLSGGLRKDNRKERVNEKTECLLATISEGIDLFLESSFVSRGRFFCKFQEGSDRWLKRFLARLTIRRAEPPNPPFSTWAFTG